MWSALDYAAVRKPEPPFEPVASPPAEGEPFAADEQGYRVRRIDGVNYPLSSKLEAVRKLKSEFVLADNDVLICTYPKCGTTWMQHILLLLQNGGDPERVKDTFAQAPWLEMDMSMHGAIPANPSDGPLRFLKTHAPACGMPYKEVAPGAKTIVVVRNPFDAAVSMWHHSRDVPSFAYSGEWTHFLEELFVKGATEFGDFWEWHGGHYARWQADQGKSIMWISYEEMKADPADAVRRVAAHVGIAADDALVAKVVEHSSFGNMKQHFESQMDRRAEKGMFVKKNHLRQGQSKAWKKTFTVAQFEMFEAEHKRRSAQHNLPEGLFDY